MSRLMQFTVSAFAVVGAVCTNPHFAIAQDATQAPKAVTPELRQQLIKKSQLVQLPDNQRLRVKPDMTLFDDIQVKNVNLGKYWIGLSCVPVSAALRSQLELVDGQGLLVNSVPEDSPAGKAGLKPHDVIVKAGDAPIGSVEDLINAVQKAKTDDLSVEIFRAGKATTINVKPAERPAEQQGLIVQLPQQSGPSRLLQHPNQRFTIFEPGVVVERPVTEYLRRYMPQQQPHNVTQYQRRSAPPQVPNGVSITITRRGGAPTAIHVERDGNKWDISESEIDQLPEELRTHVQALLNPRPLTIYVPLENGTLTQQYGVYVAPTPYTPAIAPPKAVTPNSPSSKPVETEIEVLRRELAEQLKQLHEKVDALRKSTEKE
jgi:membrane-associated protease RseP (regulator of RpoE activity)